MISIGIAAYNEENNISDCIKHLERGVSSFGKDAEILVCLNGCQDDTEKIIRRLINTSNVSIKILHAKKGKLNAHKEIIDHIHHDGIVFFCDADVIVPRDTIKEIICEFKNEPQLKIISAYPYVFNHQNLKGLNKIAYKVLNIKRIHPKVEVAKNDVEEFHSEDDDFIKRSRIYFHGRFFALRNKDIYEFPRPNSLIRGDDSFLSRAVLLKFGGGSIRVLFNLPVFCAPVLSLREYLKTWYRIRKDLDMIYKEYPEYKVFKKKTVMTMNWKYFRSMNSKEKVYFLMFYILKRFEAISYLFFRPFVKLDNLWCYKQKTVVKET